MNTVTILSIVVMISSIFSLHAAGEHGNHSQAPEHIIIGNTLATYQQALKNPANPDNEEHVRAPILVENVKKELNWDAEYDPRKLETLARYIEKKDL